MTPDSTHASTAPIAGPLDAILRQHGATMVPRDGRWIAADFGSPTSETAVCLSAVGLADRSDRTTLELRGAPADVEAALQVVELSAEEVGCAQVSRRDAIVRCNHADADTCIGAMLRADVAVEVTDRFAAVELIGPRATQLIRAAVLELSDHVVIVVEQDPDTHELLIDRASGPMLWSRLLEAGASVSVACVGLDALAHLAAARHINPPHDHAIP